MPVRIRDEVVEELKAFYDDLILSDPKFVENRRDEIRALAGLKAKDPRVPKFTFVHLLPKMQKRKKTSKEDTRSPILQIGESEVQHDVNFPLVASFLASFAANLPFKLEWNLSRRLPMPARSTC